MEELFKIKYIGDMKALIAFIKLSNNANNNCFGMFVLSTRVRSEICQKIGVSNPAFSGILRRLKELEIIRGDGGSYQISYKIMNEFVIKTRDQKYYTFEQVYGSSPKSK